MQRDSNIYRETKNERSRDCEKGRYRDIVAHVEEGGMSGVSRTERKTGRKTGRQINKDTDGPRSS